jgi:hypothetical protein
MEDKGYGIISSFIDDMNTFKRKVSIKLDIAINKGDSASESALNALDMIIYHTIDEATDVLNEISKEKEIDEFFQQEYDEDN